MNEVDAGSLCSADAELHITHSSNWPGAQSLPGSTGGTKAAD